MSSLRVVLVLFTVLVPLVRVPLAAQMPRPAGPQEARAPLKAPTHVYQAPPTFLLLRLGGDHATFHYVPGTLDRAANLQFRLELVGRHFEKWTDQPTSYVIYTLTRREWEEAGYDVEYGIPIRIGTRGLAAPARGDAETVKLWAELLGGMLPTISGTPIMGTPQEVASLVVADVFAQVHASQIMVDNLGLGGNEPWVRGVMAHLASLTAIQRLGTDRPQDLAVLYQQFLRFHAARSLSLRDYAGDLTLRDWLYFQAQFHFAARTIYQKDGKKSLGKVRGLAKKGNGAVPAELLRRKYKLLDEWLRQSFSSVSFRP